MKYVRYDGSTGRILSIGEISEELIDELIANGDLLIKTGETLYPLVGYKVDLQTLEIVVDTVIPSHEPALKSAIRAELARTDYTQSADASEHITPELQASWRDYRRFLRDAHSKSTFDEIIDALPPYDAKGTDQFYRFRHLRTVPSPTA